MEFAENLKLENCIYHKDVVDAMFRQTRSNEVIPFKVIQAKTDVSVNAADYDLGRNGFAYFDKDTANYWVSGNRSMGNKGHTYRNDGVDIFNEGKTVFVGSFEKGEWLQYTIKSNVDHSYSLMLRIRSGTPAQIEIAVNGKASMVGISTAEKWKDVVVKNVLFKKGMNILRVKVLEGQPDFQSFVFK